MNVGEQIKYILKTRNLTQRWLAKEIGIDEKTLSGKLNRNSISADELIVIGKLLKIDLNKFAKGESMMFDWLKGVGLLGVKDGRSVSREIIDVGADGRIAVSDSFDEVSKDDYGKDAGTDTLDIFTSKIIYDFMSINGWEEKLFNKLISEELLTFYTYSTNYDDENWCYDSFNVFRIFNENKDLDMPIVNYVLSCDTYGKVGRMYANIKYNESKEDFVKWLTEVIEGTDVFNYGEYAITIEESLIPVEELDILNELYESRDGQ